MTSIDGNVAATHDREMARRFLAGLDPNATKFTFQFFGNGAGTYAEIFHGTLDEVWPRVLALNTQQQGAGVFVTIGETDFKGRKVENVVRARALFADADTKEQAERCVRVLKTCGVYPSMAVNSGRGHHFYFCTDLPRDQFSVLQQQLIAKLGTDPAVKDLPRVMRLPGTLHLKDPANPRLVKLLNPPNDPIQHWQLADLVSKLELALDAAVKHFPVRSRTALPSTAGTNNVVHISNVKEAKHTSVNREKTEQTANLISSDYVTENVIIPADILRMKPAAALAHLNPQDESLTEGIKDYWFERLPPDQRDEVVDYALEIIAKNTKFLEVEAEGGNNAQWYALTTAVAVSGAPHAEEIFVKYASAAKNADHDDALRRYFTRCQGDADGRITVGTLILLARQGGADFSKWKDQAQATPPAELPSLPFINMSNWDNEPLPDREWAVPDRIPLRQVSLFSGVGGAGKSYVTLHLCVAHVLERDWLNSNPIPGPSIFVDAEDDESEIHIRLHSILRHYNAGYAEIDRRGFHLLSLAGQDALLATVSHSGKVEPTLLYHQLLQAAGDIKPKMIGIASAANVFAGNENDRSQVQQFVSLLTRVARRANGSVQLVSHPSLTGVSSGTGLSGSTHWHNAVRARSYLRRPNTEEGQKPDSDLRELEFMKVQYGSLPDTIILRYQHGMFLPETGILSLPKQAQLETAQRIFLDLLKRYNATNRFVSDKRGTNYAPALFAEEEEIKDNGLNKQILKDAMRRLYRDNKIWNEPCGKPSRPAFRIAIGMHPDLKGLRTKT